MICDNKASEGSKICVMPDVHPGKIGPIGLTMTVKDKIMPGLVGIDMGCGVSCVKVQPKKIEFQKLDRIIRENIPSGSAIRKEPHFYSEDFDFNDLLCAKHVSKEKAVLSLGTLGGGNHFIELDADEEGYIYVVVHSGSRRLGKEVAEIYMREGQKQLKAKGIDVPYELTYLEGQLMEDYLHDLHEIRGFAMLNREIITTEILRGLKLKSVEFWDSPHNYVDENRILRKGASSAYEGNTVIIPINQRDGIILGKGKNNAEWNYSAPHGAGRVMNKASVHDNFTMADYKESLKGVYSSTISRETLEEAPFAYRGIEEIAEAIKDTVNIEKIIKPVYNFKAGKRE